ncbi:MAG TPA: capsule assembly Wzi family protein [Longimicrobiales bacterium]
MRKVPFAWVLVLCATLRPSALHAQRAPVYLDPSHWTYQAVRSLSVAGVAPDAASPTFLSMSLQHAAMVFDSAAVLAADRGRPDLAAAAAAYADLLVAEGEDRTALLSAIEARGGAAWSRGEALAGDGYFRGEDFEGARRIASQFGPVFALRAHGYLVPRLSWQADGGLLGEEPALLAADVALAAGPLNIWAGRRHLQFGAGDAGAVVLGTGMGVRDVDHRTRDRFDGVGLEVRDPFYFPAFLRLLGPIRMEMELGRLDRSGRVDDPWIAFGRIVGSPLTRRITLGATRGAIFGGEGNDITAARLAGLIIGLHGGETGEFENQTFSGIARVRPPLGRLPVEVYGEWGMDDTAGAFTDVPGQVFGLEIGPLPAAPVSFVLEHSRFAHSCCGNTPWYRNVFFRGSWADEGQLFAHPLGGDGRELLGRISVQLPEPALFVRTEGFVRTRGEENLFAIEREGKSWGGTINVDFQAGSAFGIRLDAGFERGLEDVPWTLGRMSLTGVRTFRSPLNRR